MKKIDPVRGYAVFVTSQDSKVKSENELKEKLIKIISKQFSNCA